MVRKLLFFPFLLGLFVALVLPTFALDKVKLGSSIKMNPPYYLNVLAAEERGFWKTNGLEVEWVPFAGGVPHMHGFAARAVNFGLVSIDLPLMAAERGIPVIMVAEQARSNPFVIWVRADSPYRHPRDLKGAKLAVTTLGATGQSYAQIILKAHGVEKEVRFVGAGGVPQQVAGIKVGAFQALSNPLSVYAGLKAEGLLRVLASSADYLPQPWFEHAVMARKDYTLANPDITRRLVKGVLQATDFIQNNPRWAIDKMKSFQDLSEEAAKFVVEGVQWTRTGRLERKAVENIRKVFIEYGVITEKAPAVDDLFTNEYLP